MSTTSIQTAWSSMIITILLLQQTSASDSGFQHHSPKLREFASKIDRFVSRSPSSSVRPPPQVGGVFYPIGYGADPTGHNDSSDAIQNALNDAFQQLEDNKVFLMEKIKDLGGAVIDLQGGRYLISKPITFPPSGGGNLLIKEGSLRAGLGFPRDRYLVELITPKQSEVLIDKTDSVGKFQGSGCYYEDITFRDIMFDSGFSGGGLVVVDAARTRIINSYFLNFTSQAILVQGGHETFIEKCFIGQQPTVRSHKDEERNFTGTGIDLASNDNVITDTVIFAAEIGMLVRGQANMITGVHIYNKNLKFGRIGILIKKYGAYNRIVNCFIDSKKVVLEDPYFLTITNNFFVGHANILLRSIEGATTGLTMTNNIFRGPSSLAVLSKNKINDGHRFPIHAVTSVSGNVVVVESEDEVDALVSVVVDQLDPIISSDPTTF
ncbi:Polygalacturonase QRT3 [Linum perenne]